MPPLTDDGFDSNKPMTMFLKLCNIHTGIMAVPYSGADVRRWIDVDEEQETLEVNEDTEDPLAPLLVDSITELMQSETVGSNVVDPSHSQKAQPLACTATPLSTCSPIRFSRPPARCPCLQETKADMAALRRGATRLQTE